MTIQKKLIVIVGLFVLASALYGVARHYAPSLVLYVVEQSLVQKAPVGTDSKLLHARLHTLLSADPSQNAKMERLLRISEFLEKTQKLTPEELDQLMAVE